VHPVAVEEALRDLDGRHEAGALLRRISGLSNGLEIEA
jgi:hypothetical protein